MTLSLRYSAVSDVGRLRKNNQDSGYAGARLLVVADGMGGAPAGDVASAETVLAFRPLDDEAPGDLVEALAGAVRSANERVAARIQADPSVEGMGTTVTAVLFDGEQMALAHLGDSRGYRLRDGELAPLTNDHTLVQGLVDAGRLTEEEARHHPHRSMILRVVDDAPDSTADITLLDPRPGDRLLLCSDGLTGVVSEASIAEVLADGTPDSAALELTELALRAGGPDNITCIVADIVDDDTAGGASPGSEDSTAAAGGMLLVGAAAEQPRGPLGPHETSVRADTGELPAVTAADDDVDPEELRYAPRPPRRFQWLRRLAVLAVVCALLYGVGWVAYDWTQRQYYVGTFGDGVAIYQGVQVDVPGIELSSVYAPADLVLTSLPEYARERVTRGIKAGSLPDAEATLEELRSLAAQCADAARAAAAPTASAAPDASATQSPARTPGATPKSAPPTPSPTMPTVSPRPTTGTTSPCAGVTAEAAQ